MNKEMLPTSKVKHDTVEHIDKIADMLRRPANTQISAEVIYLHYMARDDWPCFLVALSRVIEESRDNGKQR